MIDTKFAEHELEGYRVLKGGAASHYAARRLQLAAAGSSPKALLAAVVTTGTRLDRFSHLQKMMKTAHVLLSIFLATPPNT